MISWLRVVEHDQVPFEVSKVNVTVLLRSLALAPDDTNVAKSAHLGGVYVGLMLATYLPVDTAPVGIAQPAVTSLDKASEIGVFNPSSKINASDTCALAV